MFKHWADPRQGGKDFKEESTMHSEHQEAGRMVESGIPSPLLLCSRGDHGLQPNGERGQQPGDVAH